MDSSKTIYVFDNFSDDTAVLMGKLYVDVIKGKESYAFEYDDSWLEGRESAVFIDPDIQPFSGRQYPNGGAIFGLFADASPDRWGRVLMMKRERALADKEKRKPRKLYDSDFLLGVYDAARMGGIRLKSSLDGEFLSCDRDTPIPAWTTLRTLEEASRRFESDDEGIHEKWLNQLLAPGSSLGGARPKATVADTHGALWIAKFPSKNDTNNIGAWEKTVSDLAGLCGLNVPESRLETFSDLASTFLVKRFDRDGERRLHFASAMTLLGKSDGASAATGCGYLDIASFIKSNGCRPKEDLKELWRRIVFSMAVSNTDDHLRNHAFILKKNGFTLSPLYDVNPVPYGDELSLNVSEDDNRISFDLAIGVSRFFGIEVKEAEETVNLVRHTVRDNWERLAAQYGIGRKDIEDMRPAFSECYR